MYGVVEGGVRRRRRAGRGRRSGGHPPQPVPETARNDTQSGGCNHHYASPRTRMWNWPQEIMTRLLIRSNRKARQNLPTKWRCYRVRPSSWGIVPSSSGVSVPDQTSIGADAQYCLRSAGKHQRKRPDAQRPKCIIVRVTTRSQ